MDKKRKRSRTRQPQAPEMRAGLDVSVGVVAAIPAAVLKGFSAADYLKVVAALTTVMGPRPWSVMRSS